MLSSASPIHLAALNFAVQASLLGFSTTIIPEGTGEVELFSSEKAITSDHPMDQSDDQQQHRDGYINSSSSSEKRKYWRKEDDEDNPLQNIVFVTGRNNNTQCLIDSEDYEKQIKLFVQRMQRRVNFAELTDLKPNGEFNEKEKNLGLDLSEDDLMPYLIGVKIPDRVEGERFRIKQIVSLENGTMILNECDSQVYIIGDVGDGIQNVETLSKISLYNDDKLVEDKIESIHNGADFAFFITESNQLYAFGQNLQKQLSLTPTCSHTEPCRAQQVSSSLFYNERPVKVACGSQHTILVTEQGNIYFSGRLHSFESTQFIICRISTVTTENLREYLISKNIGRENDLIYNGYIVKKSTYWLWQIMNSLDIFKIIKEWISSFEIQPIGFTLLEGLVGSEKEEEAKLNSNAMTRLDSLVKHISPLDENITSNDIIQLLRSIFKSEYLQQGACSSFETLFMRDVAYVLFTEIITNFQFALKIATLLSLEVFNDINLDKEMPAMFALNISHMRKDLIFFENQFCFTQKGYQSVHQLVNTFYESFIVTKCNKLYHFPAKGYAAHLLTFSLLNPFLQIGPKGCENFRNRNDMNAESKRYAAPFNIYMENDTAYLKDYLTALTESGSIFFGDAYDHWKENLETLTLIERKDLEMIRNPLPYPIAIEKSDSEFKMYFNTCENRLHGNVVNISKLPEGVIVSLEDYTSYILGSNAYSEIGYPSFYSFTTHFKIHETLNKLRPSTIFSEQYSMVMECSKDATKNLDSRFITGIRNSTYLNKMLAPFQYLNPNRYSSIRDDRTFFFSGDSSGVRSISALPENDEQEDDSTKLIKESEKMVQFNHLSLLKVRFAPDLARYGYDLNLSIGLDNMIVFFTKKTEHNNSWIFMIRKLEKLVDTTRFADCHFSF